MELSKEKHYTIADYYNNTDEGKRVELISGKFYNMSPSPSRLHQKLTTEIVTTINNYIKSNNGKCEIYPAPFDVKLAEDTIVIPDISVICDIDKLDHKGCNGAPDFIIEIVSPSNSSNDYVKKLNLYLDYGVREYWIINPIKRTVLLYFFENDVAPTSYTFDDTIKVNIYKDLFICLKDIK